MEHGNSRIMTVKDLSEHLRVHPTTIYRLLRQKKIPGFRIGSEWRFDLNTITKWQIDLTSEEKG